MKEKSIVALIPARGGSKRLPRKNLKNFCGHPLIYYTIALARKIPTIKRCIVSTEDPEISKTALSFGAEVIHRPSFLADDCAKTADVAHHALQHLIQTNFHPELLVILQPNCLLRPVSLVEKAIEVFIKKRPDSVISVTESRYKLGVIQNNQFIPDYSTGARSQDLKPKYYENGLVYVTRADLVLEKKDLFGKRILPLITEPLYALGDIDTELDFKIAEYLFKEYRSQF